MQNTQFTIIEFNFSIKVLLLSIVKFNPFEISITIIEQSSPP